jgi:flagellar biosynthetic protein FlhB
MMTKTEVKDEYKYMEGNPQVKARLRSLMRDLARKRMMREVPKATVVITNPTHLAVALKYDGKEHGRPADRRQGRRLRRGEDPRGRPQNGVPIVEDKPQARSLYKLDLGACVPQELYRAVARILAQIFSRHRSAV